MNIQDEPKAEMMGIEELALVGVGLLATKAVEKVGGAIGERLVKLYDHVRAKLTGVAAGEALADFEATPDDGDLQTALKVQLKKALEADPTFREGLAALVGEIEAAPGGQQIVQNAINVGDRNVTIQTAGSGNQAKIGRP